jgi:hypothetical protein
MSVAVATTLLPVILATAGARLDWPRLRREGSASARGRVTMDRAAVHGDAAVRRRIGRVRSPCIRADVTRARASAREQPGRGRARRRAEVPVQTELGE